MVLSTHTKVKNALKSFRAIRIKIPFVENYKEYTICAILRENTLVEISLYSKYHFRPIRIGFAET